eukprot:gene23323-31654_t
MLTEIERSVCFKLGISVCEENLHGQHKIPSSIDEEANGKVLFFLPHCPYQLYCNLLWTNVSELHRIYILGNSFQSYMLRRLYYCGETKTKTKTATTEESGNRSSDISLFAEYFNENELWNSFASSLSSQEKRRMVMMKCGDSNTTAIDFAALEAAFCDTRQAVPITIKEDGSMVSSVVKIITPPRAHAACKKWIIFSDLHVKSSSIETCELVLKLVHEESVKRNAGIIFLGDFWHVRGSLSVELLNRVLKCLKEWTQPVIMIPGNHDQPLVYAFSREQILLIAEPTVCLGALWVPYRRDSAVMKAALSTREMVSVVFCHADVRGAYMNDGMRWLEIAAFPADLPIYSGPGEVDREDSSTRLRYVGSPYQTSLSEAGQEKYLYCMAIHTSQNQMTWKEEERWPIDIGRKYIKATSLSDPNIAVARSGDRVILPVAVGDKYPAERLMNELKSKGIEVELKHEAVSNTAFLARQSRRPIDPASVSSSSSSGGQPTPVGNSTIEAAMMGDENLFDSFNFDQASPNRIFDDYMNLVRQGEGFYANLTDSTSVSSANLTEEVDTLTLSANSLKQQLFEDVFREGLSIIDRLASTAAATTAKNSRFGETKDLQMHQVRLSNFGPYGGPQEIIYPLSNRGLVLIRGESSDGTGADSNGQVDSSTDIEATTDSKGKVKKSRAKVRSTEADSAAVEIRTAEVTVNGTINGRPFFVTRRRSAKKSELLFSLDGKNLTTQAVKDTQAVMDEVLGIGGQLLQRCCFFGQHSHTLEAKDKVDKARLSEIGIEHRLRSEELAALSAIHTSTIEKQHCANTDLSLASIPLRYKAKRTIRKIWKVQLQSQISSLNAMHNDSKRKEKEFLAKDAQLKSAHSALQTALKNISLPEQPNLDTTQTLTTRNYREEYENCLKLAAACDERLKALRSALTALQANALTSVEHDHGAEDNCPTCGQLFPEEGRPDRERELNAQIKNIEKEKSAVLKSVKDVQKDLQKHESDKGVATAAMGEVDADLNRAAEENAADFEKCLTDLQRQEKDTRAMADENIANISSIREMLLNIFGTRGIQNYVFLGLLKQIEFIANKYLEVLADGGIQLSMIQEVDNSGQTDEKDKKKKKGKEKSAVKVSMALDLAFAETVRRRGILKTNILVMDEVIDENENEQGRRLKDEQLRVLGSAYQTVIPKYRSSCLQTWLNGYVTRFPEHGSWVQVNCGRDANPELSAGVIFLRKVEW